MSYKKLPNDIGVYAITNLVNGKVYIGSSRRLHSREREHFNSLVRGDHHNQHLQSSFNMYGIDSFEFRILEITTEENLQFKEQYYMDKYPDSNKYNICIKAFIPEPISFKVAQYSLEGSLIRVFKSVRSASREVGVDNKTITAACTGVSNWGNSGKCVSSAGYQWRYFTDTPLKLIAPARNAIRRDGLKWSDYWKSGNYTIYVWDISGALLETTKDIFKLAEKLGTRINCITRNFRKERPLVKGVICTLNDPVSPGTVKISGRGGKVTFSKKTPTI